MKPSALKKQMAEKIWLNYFNRTLLEQGVITEPERNRLALRIGKRGAVPCAEKGLDEMPNEQPAHEISGQRISRL